MVDQHDIDEIRLIRRLIQRDTSMTPHWTYPMTVAYLLKSNWNLTWKQGLDEMQVQQAARQEVKDAEAELKQLETGT